MAFDLLVWKWVSGKEGTEPAQVAEALNEDDPHPAITRFDRDLFESAIRARFGDVNDDADGGFVYEVSDFTAVTANWICFSLNWSQVENVCPVLTAIAKSQGLAVYDPQDNTML